MRSMAGICQPPTPTPLELNRLGGHVIARVQKVAYLATPTTTRRRPYHHSFFARVLSRCDFCSKISLLPSFRLLARLQLRLQYAAGSSKVRGIEAEGIEQAGRQTNKEGRISLAAIRTYYVESELCEQRTALYVFRVIALVDRPSQKFFPSDLMGIG